MKNFSSRDLVIFLSIWVLNSLLFVLFAQFMGGKLVLGNDRVVMPMAALIAGFLLTLATFTVEPILKKGGSTIKDKRLMAVFYFVANFAGIWVIKRLERITGVGISGNLYVGIVAVVATLAQWAVVEYLVPVMLGGRSKKK